MPTIERLAHVGICVHHVEPMLAFYRDILDLQVIDHVAQYGDGGFVDPQLLERQNISLIF